MRDLTFRALACGLLMTGLLWLGTTAARAQTSLGISGVCAAAIGGDETIRRLGAILTERLGEPVVPRVFSDDAELFQWMERYRMVDLGLASSAAAGRQPAGRFLVVGRWPAGDGLFLVRPDLPAEHRAAMQELVETMLPPEEHRRAVDLARQGQLDEALRILKGLAAAQPDEVSLAYDLLVVLGWAEKDEEAAALAPRISPREAPAYVLESLGKSLRNTRRFEEAITLYAEARSRFPERSALGVGQVYALADAGRLEEAGALAENLRRDFPGDATALEAGAYVARRRGDLPALLDWSQRMLELVPDHNDAQRDRILALDGLGASHLAVELAEKNPRRLSREELMQSRANRAALQVRWGTLEPATEAERFTGTDQALARLEENLAALDPKVAADAPLIRQERLDRLVALRDRVRMDEVVAEYHRLVADGVEIPAFALQASADAFLYLRQPETARDLYLRVIETQPKNFSAKLSLFYAYIELEDFDQALPLVDQLANQEPIWVHPAGNRVASPNRQRLDAEVAAALARLFGDDLPEAKKRIEAMRDLAPRNPDLVRQAGDIQAARGWPQQARETYLQARRIDPANSGLSMSLAANHFERNEFDQAEPIIADLYRRYPENRQAQRLLRRWEIHRMRELRAGAAYADTSGAEPASQELRLDSTLFSSPFLTHYRAFAGWSWSRADFPEGRGIYRRYGVGLEYRGPDLDGTFEISANQADGDDLGLALAGRWRRDDHWSFPFAVERFSRDTPLRALRNGIDANAARLGVDYLRDESGQWGLSGQALDFSDGNRRTQVSGYLRERLVSRPHYKLDSRLDLGSASNSQSDGPYFSPERDFSAELTLDNRWLLYRRYSVSFGHRLALSGGGYWQRNFGGAPVASLLYEHNWQAYERLALDYGAIWRRRSYDGEGETGLEYFLRLGWRF